MTLVWRLLLAVAWLALIGFLLVFLAIRTGAGSGAGA